MKGMTETTSMHVCLIGVFLENQHRPTKSYQNKLMENIMSVGFALL